VVYFKKGGDMIIKVLFIQRIESYPEEYAPEALLCVDEYTYDDNPEWFEGECKKILKEYTIDIVSSRVVDIEVSQEQLRKILLECPTIKGDIL
jgi:hypothetical protein